MKRLSNWSTVRFTLVNFAAYIAFPVLGWGSWSALVAHPARAGAIAVIVVLGVVALFGRAESSSIRREDKTNRWILLPFAILGFFLEWLPAYSDREDIGTIDSNAIRYVGLALFIAGNILRVGAVSALGRRHSNVVIIQKDHELETSRLYRIIRHPNYLGLLVGLLGWALVFRSAISIVVSLLMLPLLVSRMNSEESLLESEFGEQYAAYRRRTWRLLPLIY